MFDRQHLMQQILLTVVFTLSAVLLYAGFDLSPAAHWYWFALLFAIWLIVLLAHNYRFTRRTSDRDKQHQFLLETVSNASPVIVWSVDRNGTLTDLRGRALEETRWQPDDLIGKSISFVVDNDPEFLEDANRAMAGEQFASFRELKGRYYRHHYYPSVNPRGEITGYSCVSVDLSREKDLDAKVELSEQIFANTGDAIVVTDDRRNIISVNKAFTRITGYEQSEVVGARLGLPATRRQSFKFYKTLALALKHNGTWSGEVWGRRKSGELFTGQMTMSAIREGSRVTHYINFFSDVTDLKKTQEELQYLANHDTLTNLPNRRLFLDRLEQGIRRARRLRGKLAIYFIDLDNFKLINDSLGHAFGDELLKDVGVRLQGAVRETDTVARLAGDEFTVIAENVRDSGEVTRIAKKILACFDKPFVAFEEELIASASVGIGIYPDDGEDMSQLMRNADAAMYKAKSQGRNGYYYLSGDTVGNVTGTLFFPSELRLSLKREQMELLYQPEIDLRNGQIVGCEALLRWNHHCRGQISPRDFLPMAKDIGILDNISEWILGETCGQINVWRNRGVDLEYIAVNINAEQINNDNFIRAIGVALEANHLSPTSLVVEIPEYLILDDLAGVRVFLQRLREIGVQSSIDDFGSSALNYGYLKSLPVDMVKLQRKQLLSIKSGKEDFGMLRALIGIADVLDIKIVAVGVERALQDQVLQEMGCRYGQGFLYAKPMTSESFSKFFTASLGLSATEWKVG